MFQRFTRTAALAAAAAAASSRTFASANQPARRFSFFAASAIIGAGVFAASSKDQALLSAAALPPKDTTKNQAPPAATKVIRVCVGTKAYQEGTKEISSKVTAVKKAFEKMYDGFQIECNGFDDVDGKVKSQVADQPTSDFETQSGALNRAREAKRLFQEKGKTADFYVGVEGGFCPMPELKDPAPNSVGTPGGPNCKKTSKAQENFYLQSELQNFTWVVVLQDGNSKVGASRSASFQLPARLSEYLLKGMELGDADAEAFGRTIQESKQEGTVSFLTNGKVEREENITNACKLALIPFLPRWSTGTKSDAGGGASS